MADVAWYWLRPVQVDGELYVLHAFPGRELYAPASGAMSPTLFMVACTRFAFLPPANAPRDGLPPLERCPDCVVQMAQAKADGITVYAPLARDELNWASRARPTDMLTPSIEPSGGASPEHLLPVISQRVERELRPPAYPAGAYALYRIVCQCADSGMGTLDLVDLVEGWTNPYHPDGPPIGLNTITQVLDCADALERGGFLRRIEDAGGERWAVLLRGKKREIPESQKRMWGLGQ